MSGTTSSAAADGVVLAPGLAVELSAGGAAASGSASAVTVYTPSRSVREKVTACER